MSLLLHIAASPNGRSTSSAVADAFLEACRLHHRDLAVGKIDVWRMDLPPFDAETIDAKFAVLRKQAFTPAQWRRWEAVRSVARRFNAADKFVISTPMWNFGLPYPLKHFIDVVTLPGENWTWSKERGYEPLLAGRKALLICSSANDYGGASAHSDFQQPYLRRWLAFIGVNDVEEITIAPTLADPAAVAATHEAAIERARRLAVSF